MQQAVTGMTERRIYRTYLYLPFNDHTPAKRLSLVIVTTPSVRMAEYCDERVCLSASIFSEIHVRLQQFGVPVTYGRGSVLFWRRCDMLCTSAFMMYVIFAQNGPCGDMSTIDTVGASGVIASSCAG